MPSVHDKHRRRVKDEFLLGGMEHFPEHKVLELLLFYALPRGDTNELAHTLISRFGSLSGAIDAPMDLLCEEKGVGPETATYLNVLSGAFKKYAQSLSGAGRMITDSTAAKEFMQLRFMGESVEHLYFAGLGANGRVLFCKRLSEGSPDTVGVTPSAVVKAALRADAAKVVLAHNHPYGICNPSGADLRTTQILAEELRRVDVELMDHIIVAADGVCSMREQGMIRTMRNL
ncbi:MAG: DNA repair protein RadC [Oscillospiraceae bacterium]|nr:DNA repair protein RadC [Oscillospiraceae bacterium]